jgi:hypothetical protein
MGDNYTTQLVLTKTVRYELCMVFNILLYSMERGFLPAVGIA